MKAALLAATLTALAAQEHHISNGRIEARNPAEFRTLASQAAPPAWIAYPVAAAPRMGFSCCHHANEECAGCYLEGRRTVSRLSPRNSVNLEPSGRVLVLYRVANGRIEKIRTFSPDCDIDAGGLAVYWLAGVTTKQSLDWLVTLAQESSSEKKGLPSAAVTAIAMHAGPEAVDYLIQHARRTPQRETARTALMWLARSTDERARRFFEEVFSR